MGTSGILPLDGFQAADAVQFAKGSRDCKATLDDEIMRI